MAYARRAAILMGRFDEYDNIAPHVAYEAKHDGRRSADGV